MHDVIIVGGSYAGMAAALQLLRARRDVLIIDEGLRRNRFASHSHGFLGQDGADPAALTAMARTQLELYPTLTWTDGRAMTAEGRMDDFRVTTTDGRAHSGRRILLALGVADTLPSVPGLSERWGQSVFHCPYCHGYELGGGPIGVIAAGANSAHQAEIVNEWGPVTLFTNNIVDPDPEPLLRRGITVEATTVSGIEDKASVRLADGRLLPFSGLFTAPLSLPASDLWSQLGCEDEDSGMGRQICTDKMNETTVPGVYACGDAGRSPHSVSLAVGDGAWAGTTIHRSLVF